MYWVFAWPYTDSTPNPEDPFSCEALAYIAWSNRGTKSQDLLHLDTHLLIFHVPILLISLLVPPFLFDSKFSFYYLTFSSVQNSHLFRFSSLIKHGLLSQIYRPSDKVAKPHKLREVSLSISLGTLVIFLSL